MEYKEQMERVMKILEAEKKKDRKKAQRKYLPQIRKLNKDLIALNQ